MKYNWKLIKKLISDYQIKQEGGGDDSFTPIFVHKNTFPVRVDSKFVKLFSGFAGIQNAYEGQYETSEYNYIIYAGKKNIQNFNYFWVKIVINNQDNQAGEPIKNEQLFAPADINNFFYQVALPGRIFGMRGKEKDILLFDGRPMSSEGFSEAIGKWLKKTKS